MSDFDIEQLAADAQTLLGRILCWAGVHKWGDWHRIGPGRATMHFGRYFITLHVAHNWRGCKRCKYGYRLRRANP